MVLTIHKHGYPFVPLAWQGRSPDEMLERARQFYGLMDSRRSEVAVWNPRPIDGTGA